MDGTYAVAALKARRDGSLDGHLSVWHGETDESERVQEGLGVVVAVRRGVAVNPDCDGDQRTGAVNPLRDEDRGHGFATRTRQECGGRNRRVQGRRRYPVDVVGQARRVGQALIGMRRYLRERRARHAFVDGERKQFQTARGEGIYVVFQYYLAWLDHAPYLAS